ncbi:c-type cytochrome [Nitratifractor sp.]
MKRLYQAVFFSGILGLTGLWAAKSAPIQEGKEIFRVNCALCHAKDASGAGGPALDGRSSSHATHHSPETLLGVIARGRVDMPAFATRLDDRQRAAVFAYIHSLWPKKVRKKYDRKFATDDATLLKKSRSVSPGAQMQTMGMHGNQEPKHGH